MRSPEPGTLNSCPIITLSFILNHPERTSSMTCEPRTGNFVHHLAHSSAFSPSLVSLTNEPLPVPNVPFVPDLLLSAVPGVPNLPFTNSSREQFAAVRCSISPAIFLTNCVTGPIPAGSPVPNVPNPSDTTGALCLSSWPYDSSGCCDADESHSNEDRLLPLSRRFHLYRDRTDDAILLLVIFGVQDGDACY